MRASLVAQLVKNPSAMQETPVLYWVGKIHWRKDRLPTSVFLGFPGGSAGKEYTCKAGDLGWIPGLGRSLGEGKGYSFQYFGLENSTDCIVHGVTKTRTRLSNFHFTVYEYDKYVGEVLLFHYAQTNANLETLVHVAFLLKYLCFYLASQSFSLR